MKDKVLILLSGGIDSVTALYDSMNDFEVVGGLSFDYSSKHNAKEIAFAKYHCEKLNIPHKTIELNFIAELFNSSLLISGGEIPDGHYEDQSMKSTVVPFRNGIMLSIACGYCASINGNGVVIGAHSGDHAIYPDCRNDFMDVMGQAMEKGTYDGIKLLRPFISVDKTEIVRIGTKLNIDYSKTWSCYKGKENHCGTCGTCVERQEAFKLCKIADPTKYD